MFNKRIRDRICTLSDRLSESVSTEEFMDDMVQFYKDFGVGKLGLHKAFRLEHRTSDDTVRIVPENPEILRRRLQRRKTPDCFI